jgi:hypothetical protein
MSRDELVDTLMKMVELWEFITTRNQDLSPALIDNMKITQLRNSVKWYVSDQGRSTFGYYLIQFL